MQTLIRYIQRVLRRFTPPSAPLPVPRPPPALPAPPVEYCLLGINCARAPIAPRPVAQQPPLPRLTPPPPLEAPVVRVIPTQPPPEVLQAWQEYAEARERCMQDPACTSGSEDPWGLLDDLWRALTSECAQGIYTIGGVFIVGTGSAVTGIALIQGGALVTTTAGTTITSATAIGAAAAPPGGTPMIVRLGGLVVSGAQQVGSCGR